jgi:hypothetical protein
LEVSLFACSWSSSSVRCFATLGKPLSKDRVTKGKEGVKEEENVRKKKIFMYQSGPALAGSEFFEKLG